MSELQVLVEFIVAIAIALLVSIFHIIWLRKHKEPKYSLTKEDLDRFRKAFLTPSDEWQNGYDRAWEEAEVFYEKEEPFGPCDLCRFNPPSSADGKPCTMCPAEKGGE